MSQEPPRNVRAHTFDTFMDAATNVILSNERLRKMVAGLIVLIALKEISSGALAYWWMKSLAHRVESIEAAVFGAKQ